MLKYKSYPPSLPEHVELTETAKGEIDGLTIVDGDETEARELGKRIGSALIANMPDPKESQLGPALHIIASSLIGGDEFATGVDVKAALLNGAIEGIVNEVDLLENYSASAAASRLV